MRRVNTQQSYLSPVLPRPGTWVKLKRFLLHPIVSVIGGPMKITFSSAALCLAISLGFASGASAQSSRLSFEGDIVRGDQEGAPGPGCVLNNQFKRLEKV